MNRPTIRIASVEALQMVRARLQEESAAALRALKVVPRVLLDPRAGLPGEVRAASGTSVRALLHPAEQGLGIRRLERMWIWLARHA